MNKQLHLATLQGIQFLRGISREHVAQIADISQMCDYEPQEAVFHEGGSADCVYLVVFGKLSIEVGAPAMECKHIVTLGPGEMLGWSSLLERRQLSATARALEPTRLVQIDSAKLLEICGEDSEFGFQFMHRVTLALGKRLNATWRQLSRAPMPHFLPLTPSVAETGE